VRKRKKKWLRKKNGYARTSVGKTHNCEGSTTCTRGERGLPERRNLLILKWGRAFHFLRKTEVFPFKGRNCGKKKILKCSHRHRKGINKNFEIKKGKKRKKIFCVGRGPAKRRSLCNLEKNPWRRGGGNCMVKKRYLTSELLAGHYLNHLQIILQPRK